MEVIDKVSAVISKKLAVISKKFNLYLILERMLSGCFPVA